VNQSRLDPGAMVPGTGPRLVGSLIGRFSLS